MAKALPFFKFDADDWLTGKIQLLSAVEKGIFIDLVARIWKENGFLRKDDFLYRLIRVQKATLAKALETFCTIGIMTDENGILRVKFIDAQLNQRREYIECQREIGRRGGRPQKGTKPKQKAESRKQKAENTVSSLRSDTCEGEKRAPSCDQYPQSVEEVLAIAEQPTCGVVMTRTQAEAYFAYRMASDWIDASNRRIIPSRIRYDIRKWVMRDSQGEKNNPNRKTRATFPGDEDTGKEERDGF